MLTVVRRPRGYRISDTVNSSYNLTDSGGLVLLTGGSGLTNGQRVQIRNSYTSYNGFVTLVQVSPGNFNLIKFTSAEQGQGNLEFTQAVTGVNIYPSVGQIDYSCAHLPIRYRLQSSKFPSNSFDSTGFISAFYNDNGFIKITVSAPITNVEALDYLFISDTSVDSLDGAFQVLTKHSTTQFTINAPYSLASGSIYTYASATVIKYYNNYVANIRIYAGLPAAHVWQPLKEYELILEESFQPDANTHIDLNVADKIKEQIEILNNRPNYDSMPYDLDRFCFFYIEYAESYDSSDGSTVTTFTSSYTSDASTFEGIGVDAKNEFKDRYSGYLSNFVYCDASNLAKFLTDALQPVIFNGLYFDLSVINNFVQERLLLVQNQFNEADTLLNTFITELTSIDDGGILRLELDVIGSEFYQNVFIANHNYLLSGVFVNGGVQAVFATFDLLTNSNGTSTGSSATIAGGDTDAMHVPVDLSYVGQPFYIKLTVNSSQLDPNILIYVTLYNQLGTQSEPLLNTPIVNGTYYLSASGYSFIGAYLEIALDNSTAGFVDSWSVVVEDQGDVYTDEKTLLINQDCYNEYIYLEWKNIRGGFDKWLFTGFKDHNVNIIQSQEKSKNIYVNWDESYNEFADSITQETSRTSRKEMVVRSQNMTEDQINYVSGIKTSSQVYQVTSKYDRRAVRVDKSAFTIKKDSDKTYSISFTIINTDEIPSQSL